LPCDCPDFVFVPEFAAAAPDFATWSTRRVIADNVSVPIAEECGCGFQVLISMDFNGKMPPTGTGAW